MFRSFLTYMGIVTAVAWLLMFAPLYFFAEPPVIWGVLGGWSLATVCFMAGFYALCRYFHRSMKALMITVFGGMLARLAVIGGVFLLVVKLTPLHPIGFVSSLLGFYIVYMSIELYFVNTRLHKQGGL